MKYDHFRFGRYAIESLRGSRDRFGMRRFAAGDDRRSHTGG